MRYGVVACGLAAVWTTASAAQTLSPEAERLMHAARQQGMRITPEQAERLAERQRQIAGQLGALGLMGAGAAPTPAAPAATAELSEAQLGAVVQAARRAGSGVTLDGTDETRLVVDGRRHVDPEGELANVAADADRNAASFLVGRGNSRTVKFAALTDTASAIPVGRLTQGGRGFTFEGRTGVRIAGDKFVTLPDGIALWRDDALFLYRYGAPVASHALPEGWYPAGYQRGDVGGTGVVLLRRDQRGESANAGAVRAVKSLFAMAGAVDAAGRAPLRRPPRQAHAAPARHRPRQRQDRPGVRPGAGHHLLVVQARRPRLGAFGRKLDDAGPRDRRHGPLVRRRSGGRGGKLRVGP